MAQLPFGHDALVAIASECNEIFQLNPRELSKKLGDNYTRKVANLMRERLHRTIESTIGREFFDNVKNLGSNKSQTWKDDPSPPNFFEWRFTDEYGGFPNVTGITQWSLRESRLCNEALEKGWLYVFDLKRQVAGTRMTPIGVVDKGRKRDEEVAKKGGKDEDAAIPTATPARTRSERKSRSATERQPKSKAEISSVLAGSESRTEARQRAAPAHMTPTQEFYTFITPLFNNWSSLNRKAKAQEQELADLKNINQSHTGKPLNLGARSIENDTSVETGLRAALDVLTTEMGKYRSEIVRLKGRNITQEKRIADLNDEIRMLRDNFIPGANGVQNYPAASSSNSKASVAPKLSPFNFAAKNLVNKLAHPAKPIDGPDEEEDIYGVSDEETRRSKNPKPAAPRPISVGSDKLSIQESVVIGETASNFSSALKLGPDIARDAVSLSNGNGKVTEDNDGGNDSKKRPASRESHADTSFKSRKLDTGRDRLETRVSPTRGFASLDPE